jgi:hypothetical protein
MYYDAPREVLPALLDITVIEADLARYRAELAALVAADGGGGGDR